MIQCYSTCSVAGHWFVGGLIGENGSRDVTACCATGMVFGSFCAGGLVGDNQGGVTVCYSSGTVGGGESVGGLAGRNAGDVTACYSTGAVRGDSSVGGLVGSNTLREAEGTATACFWDTQTSGQTPSAGGVGKTTPELQTARTFIDADWDFVGETKNGTADIWWILEGKDYPRLWWELPGKK